MTDFPGIDSEGVHGVPGDSDPITKAATDSLWILPCWSDLLFLGLASGPLGSSVLS